MKNTFKVYEDEGFLDICLLEVNISKIGDKFLLEYGNDDVGFKIEIDNLFDKQPLSKEDNNKFLYFGKGKIINIGEGYKTFVEIISEIYDVENTEILDKDVSFSLVGIVSDPSKMLEEEIRMKLFFNEDNENLYSEIFLNTNFQEKTIILVEKDIEYREGIVYSFA